MVDISKLVTTKYLCKLFNKTPMTIYLWRRYHGLPFVAIPGVEKHAVRFDIDVVKEWAENNGKEVFDVDVMPRRVERSQLREGLRML